MSHLVSLSPLQIALLFASTTNLRQKSHNLVVKMWELTLHKFESDLHKLAQRTLSYSSHFCHKFIIRHVAMSKKDSVP